MLQRSLHRALRSRPSTFVPSLFTPATCHTCTCRCGALLTAAPAAPAATHSRRSYARKAPVTRDRERRRRLGEVGDPESTDISQAAFVRKWLQDAYDIQVVPCEPYAVFEFIDKTIALANQTGRSSADPVRFRALMDRYGMDMGACWQISRIMLRWARNVKANAKARSFLYTISRAGCVEATMIIMHEACMSHRKRPMVLKSAEIQYAKAHLTQLANMPHEDQDYRAMVLEGKVAQAQKDEDRAIQLWTRAMKQAVEVAEKNAARQKFPNDELALSTPWIELMFLYHERSERGHNEMDKCLWAIDVGCKLDDATSHYYAAAFKKRYNEDGSHYVTSDWLYHMTKAAASQHQKAVHELGVFYAESGWKYIDEEPPDELKPTPFDSYPGSYQKIRSTWRSIKQFFGFGTLAQADPQDQLFHTALFPYTAKERYQLAFKWLELNQKYYYAPSYLFAAQMYMQETLWAGADAPKAAIKMLPERYDYSSKAKYEAGEAIHKRPQPEPKDPPNPFYDPEKAKALLVEVFYAYDANETLERRRANYEKARREGSVELITESDLTDESFHEDLFSKYRKWLKYPEAREMYEDQIRDVYAQAKAICDEKGWDLFDEEGGLIYRAEVSAKSLER